MHIRVESWFAEASALLDIVVMPLKYTTKLLITKYQNTIVLLLKITSLSKVSFFVENTAKSK